MNELAVALIKYTPATLDTRGLHYLPVWRYENDGYRFAVYREGVELIGTVNRPDGTSSHVYGAGDDDSGPFHHGVDGHTIIAECGTNSREKPVTTFERAVLDLVREYAIGLSWQALMDDAQEAP